MGQDACVSAFQAVTRTSYTNGSGLAIAVWTRFGHDASRAGAFSPREGPWGVWPGVAYDVRTSQICVKNHGTRYKPQEGPSEEPEVQGHLRRVRGVFLSHPGGSETHLVKEVTSGF